jgi:hypothetical protein
VHIRFLCGFNYLVLFTYKAGVKTRIGTVKREYFAVKERA